MFRHGSDEHLYAKYKRIADSPAAAALTPARLKLLATAMREVVKLRQEEAGLLGYASHAEVSLVAKMASSPAHVEAFLRDLARRARPYAERDLAERREFARKELNLPDLQAWDIPFASEKLK